MLYWIKNDDSRKYAYAYKDASLQGYDVRACTQCGRNIVTERYDNTVPHLIIDGGKQFPDHLSFCGAGKRLFIVSERALDLFEREQLTGYRLQCLVKTSHISDGSRYLDLPRYYCLEIQGRVDIDSKSMQLKKKNRCTLCGQFDWNRKRMEPMMIDYGTWDGSDICLLASFPGITLCSESFVRLVQTNKLTGFSFPIAGCSKTGDG